MGEIEDPPDTGGRSGRSDENGRQNKQRVKFEYTIRDEAPYRVYFELRGGPQQGPQGGRINKFSLGSMLRGLQGYKNHIIDMKQIGRNKIMVVFNVQQLHQGECYRGIHQQRKWYVHGVHSKACRLHIRSNSRNPERHHHWTDLHGPSERSSCRRRLPSKPLRQWRETTVKPSFNHVPSEPTARKS